VVFISCAGKIGIGRLEIQLGGLGIPITNWEQAIKHKRKIQTNESVIPEKGSIPDEVISLLKKRREACELKD
jgi:hypothetical protein